MTGLLGILFISEETFSNAKEFPFQLFLSDFTFLIVYCGELSIFDACLWGLKCEISVLNIFTRLLSHNLAFCQKGYRERMRDDSQLDPQ